MLSDYLASLDWTYALTLLGGASLALALVGFHRMYTLWREDRERPQEHVDMTGGYGYDEDADTTRILTGIGVPVVSGQVVAPEAMVDVDGYRPLPLGRRSPVSSQYQTLAFLGGVGSPTPADFARRGGAHRRAEGPFHAMPHNMARVQEVMNQTQEINASELWSMLNVDVNGGFEQWQSDLQRLARTSTTSAASV